MRTAALFLVLTLCALPAVAQSAGDRATVLQNAPIFVQPGAVTPLRTAATGTVLSVVSVQGSWLQIRFNDPQFGERVGFIESRFVRVENASLRPLDLSVSDTPTPAQAPPQPAPRFTVSDQPQTSIRRGLWGGFGLGYGNAGCSFSTCLGREHGVAADFVIGGTVSQTVTLAFGQTAYAKVVDDGTLTLATSEFRVRAYTSPQSGFFITGGIGLSRTALDVAVTRTRTVTVSEYGLGLMGGLGYDARIARNVSLTPMFNWSRASVEEGSFNYVNVGLGITIH